MVKWCGLLAATCCFLLSAVAGYGQAAPLIAQGDAASAHGDYKTAADDYDQVVVSYPSTPNIEDITIRAGYAYLHANEFLKAVDVLQKLTAPATKPEFRGKALFFTGLAQFSQAHTLDPAQAGEFYRSAGETLATLLDFISKNPGPDNNDLVESAMYYQALAAYGQNKYDEAESDLDNLLAKFPSSLQKPDYELLLGSIYAVEANDAITAGKPTADVQASARKAIDTFDLVINDPNAKVQGNDARMRKGEILYLLAQIDPANYDKALEVFRQVLRKDDMIQVQQDRIDQLRAAQAAALQNGGSQSSTVGNSTALVLDREASRLNDLKSGPDAIVQALIRMAECYIGLKEPNEARTILHRLRGVTLTPDQQGEVDLQTLISYTLGGQAEKADAALTDYESKHPNDPQADSISVQIADALMKRTPPDYAGALHQAQRSLKEFPNGKHVDAAVTLEASALEKLGRVDEADHVTDDFLKSNPNNPLAYAMLVTRGEGQIAKGDLTGAVATFQKVAGSPQAGPYAASADAYLVQVLNTLKRYDDVISEAKNFETKYPQDKALPSVEVLAAMAMDKKNDPGAIPALQAVAKQFPENDEIGSFALYYVVAIYQRENKTTEMTEAVNALRTAFPKAYALIFQASDGVSAALQKQKKFDDAAALYQPLVSAPLKDVAAQAQNKIGDIWLAAAKAMGAYQSLQTDMGRQEAEKRMSAAEQAYVATLKNFPGEVTAVGDAFQGLVNTGTARVKWGLLKESDLEGYLDKQCADLSTADMKARLELAKAGLVFTVKNGHAQDAAALDRMSKAIASSPDLQLTTQEADQYGLLLIGAKQYDKAQAVFQGLLDQAKPTDQIKLAEGYYGLAATALAQNDYATAKTNLVKMLALPGGAMWSPHAGDAQLGMAIVNEQSTSPDDLAAAQSAYGSIMTSSTAGAANQAEAMLGYGRLLEKAGHAVKAANQQDIEFATHYYEQVDLFYGPALPDLSAEGLYLAAQAYTKANDTADAQRVTAKLKSAYPNTECAKK